MATWSSILTQLRSDVLNDNRSTQQWNDAQLLRFANNAIRASFPMVWTPKVDTSLSTALTTSLATYVKRRYTLPTLMAYPHFGSDWMPIYRVEMGPKGGTTGGGANSFTDEYYPPLRAKFGADKAWYVERTVSAAGTPTQTLVISPAQFVPYDMGGTYAYTIRIHYMAPAPELTQGSDVFLGPDNFINVILEWVRYNAQEHQMREAVVDPPTLQGLGAVGKDATMQIQALVQHFGCKMQRPRVIR